MSKKVPPVFNDTYDDYVELPPLNIKTETDIIGYYNSAETFEELQLVYDAVDKFNVDSKISDYNEVIYDLYKNSFEYFINIETPTHIFDKGIYGNLIGHFTDYVYYNSKKGRELEFIKGIEDEYNKKLEIERQELIKHQELVNKQHETFKNQII